MATLQEWSTKFRKHIILLPKEDKNYKKISQTLNVSRSTVGNILRKYKSHGTVATLPGRGKKMKLTTIATRYITWKIKKNLRTTAKELQKGMEAAGTKVSVTTIRFTLHAYGLRARVPRRTPLLSSKHKKSRLNFAKSHIEESDEFGKQFYGPTRPN